MPDIAKMGTLASKLRHLTMAGKLDWAETANENEFQATLSAFTASIRQQWVRQYFDNDVYEHRLTIRDRSGRKLDDVSEEDFPDSAEIEDIPVRSMFSELYDLARRRALKVDQALSDLLESLGKL